MKTNTKKGRVNTAELAPQPAASRYRVVQLSNLLSFPFDLNARDQVAFTEIAGDERNAKFYDGRMVLDLGTLGGPNAEAVALNDVPQVAGHSNFDQSGLFHAYRWSRETGMVDLGTLPGTVDSQANDINGKGEVVGVASFADPATPSRGVLWRPGSPPLDLGVDRGIFQGMKINDSSQVAGVTLDREGRPQAFSWTPTGGVVQLRGRGILTSDYRDLNGAGQITGVYEPSDGSGFTGYLWTPRRSFIGFTEPLRPAPFGMNDKGMVVGVLFLTQTAFVWTREEGAIEIGLPGEFSNAYEVNNFSQVVGQAAGTEGEYAFIWTREDGLINLNTRLHNPPDGLRVTIARQINDRGTIFASTNLGHPVLLVPFPN
jgi:probable HAF family extracellular repeat protein